MRKIVIITDCVDVAASEIRTSILKLEGLIAK